jgi:hypothetical protein
MSLDLSRVRFNSRNDFFGVVMQQGRVQLDSDWNEWVDELTRRIRAGTLDIVGQAVVPRETENGFHIVAIDGTLKIGQGRIYVDGLLAENHGDVPDNPDKWDSHLAEEIGSEPLDYCAQPYRPELSDESDLPDGGPHLVYLDVWQREISHLQRPDLVEPAVGVDTTGRRQTVWQVKVLPGKGKITCASKDEEISGWSDVTRPSDGRLSTGTDSLPGEQGPCDVPPQADYTGLENQLYRVEIHTGGSLGKATFKWSRDNATVATNVTHINAVRNQLTVESIGRDDHLRFNDGDWVEIIDDRLELQNEPGQLRRILIDNGVDEDAKVITLAKPLPPDMFPVNAQNATNPERHTRIRRWDQSGKVFKKNGDVYADLDDASASGEITVPADSTRLFLENGILVEFSCAEWIKKDDGKFKSGDYWLFAARRTDNSVEELKKAPPLGIHHHYARLAIIDSANPPSDCRVLWPPIYEGESCDCTICVRADRHNDGTATIQHALDSVKDSGGTVCLGTGTFHIKEPLHIDKASSVRLRGQGWRTILLGDSPGTIVEISGGSGITLERFSIYGSAEGSKVTASITASRVVDLRLNQVNIVNAAEKAATSVGLELSGYVLRGELRDCVIVAEQGVINSGGKKDFLLTAELRAQGNLLYCLQRGFSFDRISLHAGTCALSDNLIIGCNDASIVATGGVLDGSSFTISDNILFTGGTGIRAGVDGLHIDRNEIGPFGKRSEDGISLERGLDPVAIDHAHIIENRISGLGGSGIVVRVRVATSMIKQNIISDMGFAGLFMEGRGSAHALAVANNRFSRLGIAYNESKTGFAGLRLLAADQADILDNSFEEVAREAMNAPSIAAVLCVGAGDVRIAGNRIHGIGPEKSTAEVVAGIRLPVVLGRLAVNDNSVGRAGRSWNDVGPVAWYALFAGGRRDDRVDGVILAGDGFAYMMIKDMIILLTTAGVHSLPQTARKPLLSARGNQLHGQASTVQLVSVNAGGHCLFSDNRCEILDPPRDMNIPPIWLGSDIVNASNNSVAGYGNEKVTAVEILAASKRAVVLGNTTSGKIMVNNEDLTDPWKSLNWVV